MKNINLCILMTILVMNLSGQEATMFEESTIGDTYYDLQTWRAMQNRVYNFDDGTIGAVWNRGMNFPNFNDLGICYNYFDGNQWDPFPFETITSGWSVFPSYTDFGDNGEICVSQGESKLYINWRQNKGVGIWQESVLYGSFRHPVVITTGPDNEIVHLLYLKADQNFVPTEPQPDRGFIWYARSTDGMQTWDINEQFDEIGPDHYLAFTIGAYSWAEPKGDALGFVAGDYLTDLVLMKSLDNGDNWQKTVVWEHPYPLLEFFSINTDTFYCNNGGIAIALDNELNAHLTFGINRVFSHVEPTPLWYAPEIGGLVYWHEGMPTFSNDENALNPFDHPDSELINNYNLIGWIQDINGNGQIDTLYDVSVYPTPGSIIMPQIAISEFNEIYVMASFITEMYNNGTMDYRHLWARASPDNGNSWGWFIDLNSDILHIFDECVYSSASALISNNQLHYIYIVDNEPGIVPVGQQEYTENLIYYANVEAGPLTIYVTPDFNSSAKIINEGDSIEFQNQSSGNPEPNQFHWIFEGGTPSISNFENPTIVYSTPGVYDVTLHAYNDSVDKTLKKENYITVLPETSIKKNKASMEISITPNPTTGKITIQNISGEQAEVTVINLLGEVVVDKYYQLGQNGIVVDLAGNNEGIYFVEIKSGSEKTIQKVILRK